MDIVVCPNCGEENPAKFRLCGFCGTALAETLPPQEVRKPATFIFVDLKGSTALTERIDQEAMNEIKKRYFSVMSSEIERHGGTIEKYIGDAIMAVFGIPRAHEDDALRAVRAAHGMQQQLVRLNEDFLRFYGVELANRTGVNTGEVVANTDPSANQQLATGDTVNVAARLEQAAPANEILIGETTYDLVRGQVDIEAVEPLELKGKSERVRAFRLIAVHDRVDESTAVRAAPLVGREHEVSTLQLALTEATAGSAVRLVTVVGDPGVGKSRLVKDFVERVADRATIVRGRCLPYGDGITFWPLSEVVRGAAGIEQEDAGTTALAKIGGLVARAGDEAAAIVERVGSAIGLAPTRYPVEELFWGGRKLLEILAIDRPVVMIIDDIHSAETTFLDFLDHLIDASRGRAILILCTARHSLVETRPEWGLRTGMTRMILNPLTAEDTAGLVDELLGEAQLDEEIRDRLVRAADGNPLFVEQMVSMLVDKGLLRRQDGRWIPTRAIDDIAVPPTIQALLASRLDDLTREERTVVEPAAVIGLVFFEPAIEEMVPGQLRPTVTRHLGALDDKQFILREVGDVEEDMYRFRHLLIRDATYASLLKRTRAQLHERFVAWAERVNRERGREDEFEEIHGYHLEQAYRYRTELGPLDETGREVGVRAAGKLSNAGRRAFARGDLPAATNLLRRAALLLDADSPERIELLGELAESLIEGGDFDAAKAVIDESRDTARRLGDDHLVIRTRLLELWHGIYAGTTDGGVAATIDEITDAATRLAAAGDMAGAARGWRLLMIVHGTAGQYEAASASGQQAAEAGRAAGDGRLVARVAVNYSMAVTYGPTPADEALRRCEVLLADVAGDKRSEATILNATAVLLAMQGRLDEGRDHIRRGRLLLGELGPSLESSITSMESARVDLLADDPEAAEADLRRDYEALEDLQEVYYRSTIAGLLARVLAERGADDEARRYADLAAAIADADDTSSQVLWRRAAAILAARAGDEEAALAVAKEAVSRAAATDDTNLTADAYLDLAIVLEIVGRGNESGPPLGEAVSLYERKGDVVSAARVRARITAAAEAPTTA